MKLQLIVVETGERWRRALLRMVLDPKTYNEYGTIYTQEFIPHNTTTTTLLPETTTTTTTIIPIIDEEGTTNNNNNNTTTTTILLATSDNIIKPQQEETNEQQQQQQQVILIEEEEEEKENNNNIKERLEENKIMTDLHQRQPLITPTKTNKSSNNRRHHHHNQSLSSTSNRRGWSKNKKQHYNNKYYKSDDGITTTRTGVNEYFDNLSDDNDDNIIVCVSSNDDEDDDDEEDEDDDDDDDDNDNNIILSKNSIGVGGGGGGGNKINSNNSIKQHHSSSSSHHSLSHHHYHHHHDNHSLDSSIIKIEMPLPTRNEPRFPKEKWKTFVAAFIMFINFLLTTCSLALVHERVPDRNVYDPLPDVFLDVVPARDWALDVSEILIMILLNSTLLILLFHKHRFILFRRLFIILSLLYLMRSITMYVTVLPISSKTYYCSPKLTNNNNTINGTKTSTTIIIIQRVLQLVSGFGLSINGKHTYCGDYIYSGHTVILVLSYLFITEYSPKKFTPLHWIALVLSFTGVLMVLIAHGHYTVDVIIAYYVTTRIFWLYHTLCNNPLLKNYYTNNYIAKEWWFPFFQYFEKNVGGVVPRQYNWPFPWPRNCISKHPNRDS